MAYPRGTPHEAGGYPGAAKAALVDFSSMHRDAAISVVAFNRKDDLQ